MVTRFTERTADYVINKVKLSRKRPQCVYWDPLYGFRTAPTDGTKFLKVLDEIPENIVGVYTYTVDEQQLLEDLQLAHQELQRAAG